MRTPGVRANSERTITLPIAFWVAERKGGGEVANDRLLELHLARANAIFAAHGVRFERTSRRTLPARFAALESRADRDALGEFWKRGAIECFVVGSLRDVDEPERMRQGVHWHSSTHPGAHFVILSAGARPDVLAHELGHYLGNPKHSTGPDNLMSYGRTREPPTLDETQVGRMKRTIARYLRTRELLPLAPE
jgi:hypothetical protein